ncbi:hypothetical protein HYC85_008422 [Camellia sinensis]|uniref:Inhibitor I9 domain-containing protein n=1 Tax=Camellia sinensis TaxID=4442 RepID=A0A7J7HU26_CAMSI|nr:hypothetical protein HYC85_008422 [Camellia sinensis]
MAYRPLSPSRQRQQGMVQKPGQKEKFKRSRDKALSQRLRKLETSTNMHNHRALNRQRLSLKIQNRDMSPNCRTNSSFPKGGTEKSSYTKAFTTHHHWYHSIIDSIKSVGLTSSNGRHSTPSLLYTYDHAFHGFSAVMSKDELESLKNSPGFISSYTDRQPTIGKDVIISVIDIGVWLESESFKDDEMTKIPKRWKGTCDAGQEFNSSLSNLKLIGARYFNKGIVATNPNITLNMNSTSDTEGMGHTHLQLLQETMPMDPHSLAMLREWQEGLHHVVADGVDVILISLDFDEDPLYEDPIAIASFRAIEKGVLVSSSVGNHGPELGLLHNVKLSYFRSSTNFEAPSPLTNRLESTGATEYPLCTRNSTISPYHALGACFKPYKQTGEVQQQVVGKPEKLAGRPLFLVCSNGNWSAGGGHPQKVVGHAPTGPQSELEAFWSLVHGYENSCKQRQIGASWWISERDLDSLVIYRFDIALCEIRFRTVMRVRTVVAKNKTIRALACGERSSRAVYSTLCYVARVLRIVDHSCCCQIELPLFESSHPAALICLISVASYDKQGLNSLDNSREIAFVENYPIIYNTTISASNSFELLPEALSPIRISDNIVSFFTQMDQVSTDINLQLSLSRMILKYSNLALPLFGDPLSFNKPLWVLACTSNCFLHFESNYVTISRTSMVCPHAFGIVTLLKGAHSKLSPTVVHYAMMTTTSSTDNTLYQIQDIV